MAAAPSAGACLDFSSGAQAQAVIFAARPGHVVSDPLAPVGASAGDAVRTVRDCVDLGDVVAEIHFETTPRARQGLASICGPELGKPLVGASVGETR